LRDIDYITSSALLPYFGGGTNQYVQSGYVVPSGFEPESLIYCVLGTGEDKAKILWIVYSDWHWPPGKKTLSLLTSANTNWSIVRGTKNVETAGSSIYKDLTIKAGEMKIILEIALFVGNSSSSNFYYPDGRNAKNVSLRERFGFMILEPKRSAPREIFNTVVIFTPKPGLFSSVPPS
jgi:hypothetical protein